MSIRISKEVERIVGIGVICRRCRSACACVYPIKHALVQVLTGIRKMARYNDSMAGQTQRIVQRTLDMFAPQFQFGEYLRQDLSALAAAIVVEEEQE